MPIIYTWDTPNGRKPLILLEELGYTYELVRVDLRAGEQREPAYVRKNPNAEIPTLHDDDTGITVFDSGAILLYLAEKSGRFLATDTAARTTALSWLFFQRATVGPTFAQALHFATRKDSSPYAYERFRTEAIRLYGVLDTRLSEAPFFGGEDYGIADIAMWPWVYKPSIFSIEPGTFRNIDAWTSRISMRPAVQTAMAIPFPLS